jgi:UDP-GlcNAc:undecaprenyl-phosphate/decaprenyl-phosphate GlcNAc-1-phosphate transferase
MYPSWAGNVASFCALARFVCTFTRSPRTADRHPVALAPHAAAFLVSFLVSAAITPVIRSLARRSRLVALPASDRWHKHPVPLYGGVAIVTAFSVGLFDVISDRSLMPLLACSGLMFLLGVADDVRPIGPALKLVCQMLITGVVLTIADPISMTGWPIVDQLLAFVWIIGITNAFNLLDNMDGLAAGISALAGLTCLALLLPTEPSALTLSIAAFVGAVLGFLIYNYPPASIFMGDGGSHFLGAFLASACLFGTPGLQGQLVPAAVFAILILLVPIFDTTFVTLTRRLSGRRALVGGRDHTSHRLVALGASERVAVLSLYVLAATGGLLALGLQRLRVGSVIVLVALYCLVLGVVAVVLAHVRHPAEEAREEEPPLLSDIAYQRRSLELMLDLGLLTLAYYAAFRLRFPAGDASTFFPPFVRSVPLVVGAQIAGLYFAGKYRQVWRTLTTPELGTLLRGLMYGVTASVMLILTLYRFEGFSRGVFVIDALIAFFLLVAARAAASSVDVYLRRRRAAGAPALIYGAGRGGALLVRELLQNREMNLQPVGFIDDDPRKQRLVIEGIPVLGTLDDLGALATRHQVAQLLVAIRDIEISHLDYVLNESRRLELSLRRMRFSVDEVRAVPSVLRRER